MVGYPMSNLEIICKLCEMLDQAQSIISLQADLLCQHCIETDTGGMEERRDELLRQIEETV